MDSILNKEVLGILSDISLAEFLVIICVIGVIIGLIVKFKDKIKTALNKWRKTENKKEDLVDKVAAHEKEINTLKSHHEHDIEEMIQKQLKYRQQSLDKQADIQTKFDELTKKIDDLTKMVQLNHEETQQMKCNELREKLINQYRYFTSLETNPRQEWNEMEADAFWHSFKDYEKLHGNSYMHTVVKPAMEKLAVVKIF